jgi:uncharacterized protein DUF4331
MSFRLVSSRIAVPLLALAALLAAPSASAADHADAPATVARPSADLGDSYFFVDPNDPARVILAATLHAFIVPAENANAGYFDPGVVLRFEIDHSGDAKADRVVEVRFGARSSPAEPQLATIKLPAKRSFTAFTTVSNGTAGSEPSASFVTVDPESGVSFFGGLIDNPFFFDLPAFEAYRQSRLANQTNPSLMTRGRDAFSGYNTMAVVLSVPLPILQGADSTLGLSVSTKGRGVKDRVGHPLMNSLLIDFANRDAYNAASPAQVAKLKFAEQMGDNLRALQVDDTSILTVAFAFVATGDMLRLDTAILNTGSEGGTNPEAAYPNGRRPNDDAIDHILTLINNRIFQGDAVDDNELAMRSTFPFFALPHQPFPPGGSEDLTRN